MHTQLGSLIQKKKEVGGVQKSEVEMTSVFEIMKKTEVIQSEKYTL